MKQAYISIQGQMGNHLKQISQLSDCLQPLLSIPDVNRIWPILQRRTLLLMTDDVVVATQARFMQKTLCKQLKKQLSVEVDRIEIKLISLPLRTLKHTITRHKISIETQHILKSIASDIPNQDLGLALVNLADAISERQTQQASMPS